MNQVSFAQRAQGGLGYADVAFHAAQQKSIALARKPLKHAAKNIAGEAGK